MAKIMFISADGQTRTEVEAKTGQSLLTVAHENNIDIEGACEGAMACSTCHVIVDEKFYDFLPPASADEEDLLDMAYGLAATSRLCCQIIVSDDLDGMTLKLPAATHNLLLD
jgi:2Fe-2S ferredoxin